MLCHNLNGTQTVEKEISFDKGRYLRAKNINRKPSRRNSLARDLQNSVSSTDMKKGKQGGFRVVYFVFLSNELIVLLDIYSKTVRETSGLQK